MCTPSHKHNFRLLVNTDDASEDDVDVDKSDDDDDDVGGSNSSSMACNVRPQAAPISPVSLWTGQETTNPQTLFSRTSSDNCCLDESGTFRLPFLLIGMLNERC